MCIRDSSCTPIFTYAYYIRFPAGLQVFFQRQTVCLERARQCIHSVQDVYKRQPHSSAAKAGSPLRRKNSGISQMPAQGSSPIPAQTPPSAQTTLYCAFSILYPSPHTTFRSVSYTHLGGGRRLLLFFDRGGRRKDIARYGEREPCQAAERRRSRRA